MGAEGAGQRVSTNKASRRQNARVPCTYCRCQAASRLTLRATSEGQARYGTNVINNEESCEQPG